MKVVENSPQNARNCTIFKNFFRGICHQTPLATARSFAARDMPLRAMYIQNPRNFKVGPPPLGNPAYAPAIPLKKNAFCLKTSRFINKYDSPRSQLCQWPCLVHNCNQSFNMAQAICVLR